MIPHRMLADDIFENGLRDRVNACRKRLRANRRPPHKFPLGNQVDEVFPEGTRVASEFLDYSPEHPTRQELLLRSEHGSSPFHGARTEEDSEVLVAAGEPEVGIT